ncbi:hypothetical protein LRX75_08470 [Rhizobium sp. DKSPLA3]|uniref:Uncharacterized protein n=1 Tax=Rhizobium quercicola TaxID=2901226 RepID=A0A9X1T020_9HYPH|nr:hypothetical protein [Rhizobium quercicola]MCD7109076.1 hypothetical protein [Rhizobium quercicola]
MKKFLFQNELTSGDKLSTAELQNLLNGFLLFNESDYIRANPDVRQAVQRGEFPSGFAHFQERGNMERRFPGFNGFKWDDYIKANADLAHFREDPNPEARAKAHFKENGYTEGRQLEP